MSSDYMAEMTALWGGFLGVTDSPVSRRRLLPRGEKGKEFWDDQFEAVVDILEGWNTEVELITGVADQVLMGKEPHILINSASHPETKFYTLLHEVGHILIRRKRNWKTWAKRHPNYLDHPHAPVDGRRRRSVCYRVGLVSEELEAWRRGREWAESHGFFIDPYKYDTDMNRAVLTYIQWAASVSAVQLEAAAKAADTRRKNAKK